MAKSSGVVSALLESAEGGLFHLDDLAEEVYIAWGGSKGLATALREEFEALPPGAPGRERILDGVMKLALHRNKTGQDQMTDDLASLDEGELERRAMELLKRGTEV